ncbi:hypothetical protein EGH24_06250 [Halonotius terrestris]|uniref:Uncharacterized protein n=1 Tax=Halonotius terrestris TaxID=2487750 RepID=A0A8J8P8T2_9EURY|nr:hypothetical protein [Halonotius terrestris]TQQ83030.1 hypothetical protein EGH24_06250 [Halonotius terrestris]
MQRRTYLLGCTAGLASLAGCSAEDQELPGPIPDESEELLGPISPDLTVSSTKNSQGRIKELAASGNEYTVEVENEGISGTVLVELYFRADGVTSSSPAATQETYLDSGARTELTLTADRPRWAKEYGFETRGTRFVANVRNTGKKAEVNVMLVDIPGGTTVAEKTVHIGADETTLVEFHTDHEFTNEYEIRAVLAEA